MGKERHWKEIRDEHVKDFIAYKKRLEFKPKTLNQEKYLEAIRGKTVTICTGPAGTGKSFLSCGVAAQMFNEKKIDRIVLTRPLAECDEEVGILPGDLLEKISDSMRPMLDALEEFLGAKAVEQMIATGQIDIVPLAKMRGLTFKNSFVMLDEAQNATMRQLRMFLTRIGTESKVVVSGDHTQSDLPYTGQNSLMDVIDRFSVNCHKNIAIVKLGREDIVRHPLIQWMDERLTGAPQKIEEAWEQLKCLECQETLWFERADLVECWQCQSFIETRDEQGRFDPQLVDLEPGDTPVETYPEKA